MPQHVCNILSGGDFPPRPWEQVFLTEVLERMTFRIAEQPSRTDRQTSGDSFVLEGFQQLQFTRCNHAQACRARDSSRRQCYLDIGWKNSINCETDNARSNSQSWALLEENDSGDHYCLNCLNESRLTA